MDRDAFLARLPRRRDLARPDIPPGRGPAPSDLAAELSARLTVGGCGVRRAAGPAAALALALEIARSAGVRAIGHHDLGPELMPHLPAAASAAGLRLVLAGDGTPGLVQAIEPLAAGLTRPELAVAEVGALVHLARPGGGRLASLLPPLHIALVAGADVLPDLDALAAALADPARLPAGLPPALTLIAGPSKTGDIEAVMVKGVHGPGRVEVVIWTENPLPR